MKHTLRLTVPGPPVPKQRARMGAGGRFYTPQQTRMYEAFVRNIARASKPFTWPRDAQYRVELDIYFPDRRRRDADNVCKAFLDSCNTVLWDDDTQVIELVARKHVDKARPRIDVVVSREVAA